ncbi:MAG: hypothetical protein B1H08_04770 [Candidatus Omnitrophica bacterium 4484_171]|nr:MAG: hypothetical protein B1H08_04770 [Candidatus Omnitrophica bacterium 4484_171]
MKFKDFYKILEKNKYFFLYRSIKPLAFTGYYVEKHGNFDILIASPEKALIDYLYFKTYRNRSFNPKEERLDKDAVLRLKRRKLDKYAGLYNLNLKEFYAYL